MIELDMLEHTHTHTAMQHQTSTLAHQQTPVQVITPVSVCLLFTVRQGAVLRGGQDRLTTWTPHSLFHAMSPVLHITKEPASSSDTDSHTLTLVKHGAQIFCLLKKDLI